ncbi:ferrous iron transporter B [Actinomyces radicidentis]|uniref:Ferrous iron transporter B n=1 Tax=Actinomyces radicidentis TaxID=111015 RepID=A0A0X8JEG7_ACTRD|nr:ferrous iron transporter B [Actinomyces radicidentis]AMD87134.1 ferrous iron transporter B [Actinomyces radicidentis]
MTQPAPQQLHLHQSGHVHDSGCAHHGAGADGGASCHCGAASGEVDAANDRIALAGAPNAGKTSIYNALTGLRAKTGNYPGVTVTRAVGTCRLSGGRGTEAGSDGPEAVTIEDLPGAYSLEPISPDEQVVRDVLTGGLEGIEAPDALVVVVDATTLSRSLAFVAQALAVGLPTCLAVTMTDELTRRGGHLDVAALGRAVGVPAVRVIGNRATGIPQLREALAGWRTWERVPFAPPTEGAERVSWTESVLAAADYTAPHEDPVTAKVDRVLLHPVWGTIVFALVMYFFFQAIFTWAAPFQDAIEAGFSWLGSLVHSWLDGPAPAVAGLLGDGIIGGVGSVLTFIPQIIIMFTLIALMEGIGYMSRAAFLMDKVMSSAGLEGRAFVALLSSFACAIPGIMATRTLPSAKDRLATMLAAPLMTCSARLPVYLIMISMLVGPEAKVGPLSARGTIMFVLYLAGAVAAMTASWAVKRLTDRGGVLLPFYMEMPPYRAPRVRTVATMVWDAAKGFIKKAGSTILVATLLVWVLLNVPGRSESEFQQFCQSDTTCAAVAQADADPASSTVTGDDGAVVTDADELATLYDAQRTSYLMDNSIGATIGKAVQPVFEPLGFDWRVNVAILSSLAARETFVATLGQIGAAGDPENPSAELTRMTYQHDTLTNDAGDLLFNPATVAAILAFFVFAMQCMATAATMRRETGTWKWPLIAYGYLFVLAWAAAALTHLVVAALL